LSSATIQLKTNEIKIGDASIFTTTSGSNSYYDKLIIRGGNAKSGFRIGYESSSSKTIKATFNIYRSGGS
jgi:hypothetical protein